MHIHYAELLNTLGYLKPREQLLGLLTSRGLSTGQQIIACCTGGVRSAWFVVVLRDLGLSQARNYSGSMWEWASLSPEQHPLVR